MSSEGLQSYKKSKFHDAITRYKGALAEYAKVDRRLDVARVSNNLAAILHQVGKDKEALEYVNKALDIYGATDDKVSFGRALCNRGSILLSLGNHPEALNDYNETLVYIKDADTGLYKGLALLGIANAQVSLNKLDGTEDVLKESLTIFEGLKDNSGVAAVNLCMARLYRLRGNVVKAREHALNGLKLDKDAESSIAILQDLKELAQIEENIDKGAAVGYYSRAIDVAKSLQLEHEIDWITAKIKALQ